MELSRRRGFYSLSINVAVEVSITLCLESGFSLVNGSSKTLG